jgi:N utilization substance protein A
MRGNRIQNIVNELQGEKIDVVRWDRDLKRFISNALSPAEVVQVVADEEEHSAVVVVPERQLSLAIGKEGQNARLAAKLTGWHLDIKSMADWESEKAQIKVDVVEAEDLAPEAEEEETPVAEIEAEVEAIAEVTATEEQPDEEKIAEEEKVATPVLEEALAEILAQEGVQVQEGEVQEEEKPEPALSLEEELAALTLEGEVEEEEGEEESFVEVSDQIWEVPQLTPDAGKIRFAEDILGEDRGGGRGRRSGRGGSRSKKGPKAKARKR